MAQATTVTFGQQYLLVGDGATPTEVFTMPCGITSLSREVSTNTTDVDIPDCADPDALVWLGVDVNSKRITLTFSGVLAEEAVSLWDDWAMEEAVKNIRWYRNIGGSNAGYFAGAAVLTNYQEQGQNRGRYTISGTIIFDGKPTWTAVP